MLFNNLLIIITVKQHQNLMAEYRSIKNIFLLNIYLYICLRTKKKPNKNQSTETPPPTDPSHQNLADRLFSLGPIDRLTDWDNIRRLISRI